MKAEDEFSNSVSDCRAPASPCRPERAKKAEFKGVPGSDNNWSNPAAWVGGTVPVSDRELKVQLNVDSTEDLGNAKAPFFTDDVIGVAGKLGFPSLDVTGFLHADTIWNLTGIETDGRTIVAHQLKNVASVTALVGGTIDVSGNTEAHSLLVADEASIHIDHNLVGAQSVIISTGGAIEIGSKFGDPSVTFGISGGRLILDKPHQGNRSGLISYFHRQAPTRSNSVMWTSMRRLSSSPRPAR
jgi:hypothetical protein